MEMPLPEIIDRFTIVKLKLERIGEHFREEYNVYKKEIENKKANGFNIKQEWIDNLFEINKSIWDLEAELKAGMEDKLSLEEIGRRAIKIRNFNNKRISIKNEIAEETGDGFKEIKKDHISE